MKNKNLSQNYGSYKNIMDIEVLVEYFRLEIFCQKFSPELKRRQLQAFASAMYLNLYKLPSDQQDFFHNALLSQFIAMGGFDYTITPGSMTSHFKVFQKAVLYRSKIDQEASEYLDGVYSLSLESVGIKRRLLITLDRFPLAFATTSFKLGEEIVVDILPKTFYAFVRLKTKDNRWMKILFDLLGELNHARLKQDLISKTLAQLKKLETQLN